MKYLIVLLLSFSINAQVRILYGSATAPSPEPELPDAPTGFEAVGGTSETEIGMTWTDAEGDIDSVRVYEGSTNDTTAMTWIASVAQGVEAYTRTGRTAETTYWYAVKSYDGTNESYFSNTDSATTLASAGDTLGTNLLDNGDFEAELGTTWGSSFGGGLTRQTDTVYAGTYSLRVNTVGAGTGARAEDNESAYTLEATTTYYLTGYIYLVGGASDVLIEASGMSGSLVVTTEDEWVAFSFGFTTGAGTPTTYPRFSQEGGTNTIFYLDNVQLRELLE